MPNPSKTYCDLLLRLPSVMTQSSGRTFSAILTLPTIPESAKRQFDHVHHGHLRPRLLLIRRAWLHEETSKLCWSIHLLDACPNMDLPTISGFYSKTSSTAVSASFIFFSGSTVGLDSAVTFHSLLQIELKPRLPSHHGAVTFIFPLFTASGASGSRLEPQWLWVGSLSSAVASQTVAKAAEAR